MSILAIKAGETDEYIREIKKNHDRGGFASLLELNVKRIGKYWVILISPCLPPLHWYGLLAIIGGFLTKEWLGGLVLFIIGPGAIIMLFGVFWLSITYKLLMRFALRRRGVKTKIWTGEEALWVSMNY